MLELFAGIGGLSLGLERAGLHVVGQVEIDPWCRTVLERHWPGVPRHDDVRTALAWWLNEDRPRVDVVAGGYPCQPESAAGRGLSIEDARWLWPEMARIVHALRPRWVIGENVGGHRTRGLRFVLRDLERLGYTATPGTVRACEVGAPHARERLFTLAYTNRIGGRPGLRQEDTWEQAARVAFTHAGDSVGWPAEPPFSRMADGLPHRMDRRRGLGNAVVPAVAEHIGRIVTEADRRIYGE